MTSALDQKGWSKKIKLDCIKCGKLYNCSIEIVTYAQVWDWGGNGYVQYHASDAGREYIGYVVENSLIQKAFLRRLYRPGNLPVYQPPVSFPFIQNILETACSWTFAPKKNSMAYIDSNFIWRITSTLYLQSCFIWLKGQGLDFWATFCSAGSD